MFFIVYKGAKGLGLDDTSIGDAFAWALGLGAGMGLLMIPTVLPYMRRQIDAKFNDDGTLKPVRTKSGCVPPTAFRKLSPEDVFARSSGGRWCKIEGPLAERLP